MLNFNAAWAQPIDLIDGSHEGLTYAVADWTRLPEEPGAYVFARIHGDKVKPLYIGETANIRTRIDQHLKSNVRLMNGIKKAPNGKRILMYCTIKTNSNKRRDTMLAVLQRGLIEHALSEGYELLNIQLTKMPVHSIAFSGNRFSEQLAPRTIYVQEP
jgi:hypothetical protein